MITAKEARNKTNSTEVALDNYIEKIHFPYIEGEIEKAINSTSNSVRIDITNIQLYKAYLFFVLYFKIIPIGMTFGIRVASNETIVLIF